MGRGKGKTVNGREDSDVEMVDGMCFASSELSRDVDDRDIAGSASSLRRTPPQSRSASVSSLGDEVDKETVVRMRPKMRKA